MKRRDFLKYTGSGIVVPSVAGAVGAKSFGMSKLTQALQMVTDTDHVLVLIYLSGGNDGLNTVVPLNFMSQLNDHRPHVVLPEDSLLKLDGSDVGLHPALQGFKDLYDEDRLQVIQSVGYPEQDFSHFRSTDIWMSGSDSDEVISSGWTGRYLNYEYANYPIDYPNETMPDPLAIEVGWNNSMIFQGPSANMGMVINNPEDFYELLDNTPPPAPNTKAGERLEYVRLIARQSQQYGEVVKAAAENVTQQVDYPEDNYLAQRLKIVSRLIAGGLKTRLYMVELGGFDTHDNQVEQNDHTQGEHAYLLKMLNDGVAAFMADCDFLGTSERVMGMTFSEFGRRVISNASNGTDHGAAAPMFLFGNHANSTVTGANPTIPDEANWQTNIEMQHDFRSIYASVFEQWLCVPQEDLSDILFKDFDPIQVTNGENPCTPSWVHEENIKAGSSYIDAYPNPIVSQTTIKFKSIAGPVRIEAYDLQGKLVDTILSGNFPEGEHQVLWVPKVPAGNYFLRLSNQKFSQSRKILIVQ